MTEMSQGVSWHEPSWEPPVSPSTIVDIVNYHFVRAYIFTKDYTREAVEHLILAVIIYSVLCILLYVSIVRWRLLKFRKDVVNPRRVLIVIAHPDDECMFFGPTILNFTRNNKCLVYLLCLSTGANYGMGKTRKSELYKSCKVLGIDESCIIIQSHSLLPDSMEERWPVDLVSQMILNQVETYSIDTLITFDKHGISRHLNHSSIYYAIAYLCIDKQLPADCKVYVLESVSIIRKYWLFLDIPLCFLLSTHRYILSCVDKTLVKNAMKQHKSQLLWFRYLYLLFSRYLLINTLQEMDVMDIELDLELDD